ncbi:hypothetical protein [Auraticoccus monumenti]|uniref:Uncharacterized protein n=1 Tax=Auraticoccus monumenti TaxID=675864 RepID=A0A1G6YD78_9ACTN|nr:hypothetical protein [Auraticoccus monumenti]SDD88300.1 hypothetical protein SAMN04489747_1971 [Auraticoccus monumenti]
MSRPLGHDQAWPLLSWAEDAATEVGRRGDEELVVRAVLAFCLLGASPLDRRDVQVVAALLRRACDLAGLDFLSLARTGCEAAGPLGVTCWSWLTHTSTRTPATHEEVGAGWTFTFRRRPSDFDVDRLLARLTRPPEG